MTAAARSLWLPLWGTVAVKQSSNATKQANTTVGKCSGHGGMQLQVARHLQVVCDDEEVVVTIVAIVL